MYVIWCDDLNTSYFIVTMQSLIATGCSYCHHPTIIHNSGCTGTIVIAIHTMKRTLTVNGFNALNCK